MGTITIRELRCDLDDAAVEKKVGRLRHLIDLAKETEGERDAAKERFKSKLGGIETERDKLLRAVADRAEYRDVECEERESDKLLKVELVRTDTGAVIDEWPLSAEERQKDLDLHESSKEAKKGDSATTGKPEDVISKPPEKGDAKPDEKPKPKASRKKAKKKKAKKKGTPAAKPDPTTTPEGDEPSKVVPIK